MMKWVKRIATVAVLLGVGFFLYLQYKPEPEPQPEPQPMITFEVTQEAISQTLKVKGKSVYAEEIEVYAPLSAKIHSWNRKNGEQVKKGEVLMALDIKTLQAELKSLEFDIKKMKLDAKIQEISQQQDAETEVIGATGEERKKAFLDREGKRLTNELGQETLAIKEQELSAKKSALATAVVYAPTSGVFLYNEADVKSRMLSEGQLIGKIVNTALVKFKATVSELDVFRIKPGMSVEVQLVGQKDKIFAGVINSVSQFPKLANDSSQPSEFDVVIDLKQDKQLLGGLTLEGEIETQRKENAIVVPTLAIMRDQGAVYVMLDPGNGQPVRRDIKTGMEVGDNTEILKGLKAGDIVVIP
ncbi:hypothetical protein BBD42_24705 [Paenibacillus sp. BIHB 4019]|uniref:Uncharacterized protein n=1 Tax=Paenibacillus sp. BIHB 4019 TaxID=1870819 RepID=A0A1B2DNN2_9BACL|nr:efflux RND transporter periplasmic adaptor subunit [Paenibacillus sp. BIHB 4019]ANY69326.1 hypothetical protein BBD42_24705 [Paenibacillus sp. BIHB 4019]